MSSVGRRELLRAAWVLPVTAPPIQDGAVLIEDGRIVRVAPFAAFDSSDVHQRDLGAVLLLPGLVNVHAHPELTGFRNLLDDLPFHLWIPTLMRCKRDAQLTDDDYLASARWTCIEALRAGITTMGATETSAAAARALHEAGMRGVVYVETFGPAAAQVPESIADLRARLQQARAWQNDRVRIGISPHAPYSVCDALYIAAGELARAEGMPLATHAAEAESEELLVTSGTGPFAAGLRSRGIATPARGHSTIELLDRLGVLALQPLLIHCVRVSGADLDRIAANGASIAHCPVANARLGHGTAPVVEARERGITVAMGTDSVASNNRLDLLEEARIAQILQRARLCASGPLTAPELLRMVTIDAARALGLDAQIGSLEPGKQADLCAVSLRAAATVPLSDPVNALFHAARGSDVGLAMVGGRTLFEDDRVIAVNENALAESMKSIGDRLQRVRKDI